MVLDRLPPEYRTSSLRRHPLVLAMSARLHAQATLAGTRDVHRDLRAELRDHLDPTDIQAALVGLEELAAQFSRTVNGRGRAGGTGPPRAGLETQALGSAPVVALWDDTPACRPTTQQQRAERVEVPGVCRWRSLVPPYTETVYVEAINEPADPAGLSTMPSLRSWPVRSVSSS